MWYNRIIYSYFRVANPEFIIKGVGLVVNKGDGVSWGIVLQITEGVGKGGLQGFSPRSATASIILIYNK